MFSQEKGVYKTWSCYSTKKVHREVDLFHAVAETVPAHKRTVARAAQALCPFGVEATGRDSRLRQPI